MYLLRPNKKHSNYDSDLERTTKKAKSFLGIPAAFGTCSRAGTMSQRQEPRVTLCPNWNHASKKEAVHYYRSCLQIQSGKYCFLFLLFFGTIFINVGPDIVHSEY